MLNMRRTKAFDDRLRRLLSKKKSLFDIKTSGDFLTSHFEVIELKKNFENNIQS